MGVPDGRSTYGKESTGTETARQSRKQEASELIGINLNRNE